MDSFRLWDLLPSRIQVHCQTAGARRRLLRGLGVCTLAQQNRAQQESVVRVNKHKGEEEQAHIRKACNVESCSHLRQHEHVVELQITNTRQKSASKKENTTGVSAGVHTDMDSWK